MCASWKAGYVKNQKYEASLTATKRIVGRWTASRQRRSSAASVESRRSAVTRISVCRFPSPLIKPDVRFSRIRLSDWLHRKAHGGDT